MQIALNQTSVYDWINRKVFLGGCVNDDEFT